MAHVDIRRTRAAARALRGQSTALRSSREDAHATAAAGALGGSVTHALLHDLEGVITLRLLDASTELGILADDLDRVADNTETATGG